MEIADWKIINKTVIDVVKDPGDGNIKGYMLRFVSEGNKETRVIFNPAELRQFAEDIDRALEWTPE